MLHTESVINFIMQLSSLKFTLSSSFRVLLAEHILMGGQIGAHLGKKGLRSF